MQFLFSAIQKTHNPKMRKQVPLNDAMWSNRVKEKFPWIAHTMNGLRGDIHAALAYGSYKLTVLEAK